MKRVFFLTGVAALLLAASCAKEPVDVIDAPGISPELYASIETQDETKVYVDDNLRVLWNADDRVSVFYRYSYNKQYKFKGQTGANAGSFSEIPNTDLVTGNELDHIYAVYPYREENAVTNDGIVQVELPAVQTYAPNSFGLGMNTMVSVTDDNNLLFRNAVGYLMLKIYGDACIESVTLSGRYSGQKLAGPASIAMEPGGTPTVTMGSAAVNSVTLDCGNGVLVGNSADNYTEFWFALPPTEFTSGIKVVVTDVYGHTYTKTSNNPITIARNQLQKMAPIEVNMPHSDSDNIVFADAYVKEWLVRTCDTNHDGEISFAEAAAVTDANFSFYAGAAPPETPVPGPIKTFNELKYFTGLTSIPSGAFMYCSSLEEITLPETITSIGWAFEGCSSLKSIDVPAACKTIGYYAFAGCNNLKEITFRSPDYLNMDGTAFGQLGQCPASKMTIYAENAFCLGLHYSFGSPGGFSINGNIYVPAQSLVHYQDLCFQYADVFLPIPETTDNIITFQDPNVKAKLVQNFDTNQDGEISYGEAADVTAFPESYFALMADNTDASITSFDELEHFYSLTSIPAACFIHNANLTSIKIPRSVTSLGLEAFEFCTSLTSFVGPAKLTNMGYQTFHGCTSLADVTLYGDPLNIGDMTFFGCNLNTLTLYTQSVPDYDWTLFNHVNTLYVSDPSAYQNDESWSEASIGTIDLIPDWLEYSHTH